MNYNLIGADDVLRAGRMMDDAARRMKEAASTISMALERHERFLNEWLERQRAPIVVDAAQPEEQWDGWKGGFAPVPDHVVVWVKKRHGEVVLDRAETFRWRHFPKLSEKERGIEVVAYRLP